MRAASLDQTIAKLVLLMLGFTQSSCSGNNRSLRQGQSQDRETASEGNTLDGNPQSEDLGTFCVPPVPITGSNLSGPSDTCRGGDEGEGLPGFLTAIVEGASFKQEGRTILLRLPPKSVRGNGVNLVILQIPELLLSARHRKGDTISGKVLGRTNAFPDGSLVVRFSLGENNDDPIVIRAGGSVKNSTVTIISAEPGTSSAAWSPLIPGAAFSLLLPSVPRQVGPFRLQTAFALGADSGAGQGYRISYLTKTDGTALAKEEDVFAVQAHSARIFDIDAENKPMFFYRNHGGHNIVQRKASVAWSILHNWADDELGGWHADRSHTFTGIDRVAVLTSVMGGQFGTNSFSFFNGTTKYSNINESPANSGYYRLASGRYNPPSDSGVSFGNVTTWPVIWHDALASPSPKDHLQLLNYSLDGSVSVAEISNANCRSFRFDLSAVIRYDGLGKLHALYFCTNFGGKLELSYFTNRSGQGTHQHIYSETTATSTYFHAIFSITPSFDGSEVVIFAEPVGVARIKSDGSIVSFSAPNRQLYGSTPANYLLGTPECLVAQNGWVTNGAAAIDNDGFVHFFYRHNAADNVISNLSYVTNRGGACNDVEVEALDTSLGRIQHQMLDVFINDMPSR